MLEIVFVAGAEGEVVGQGGGGDEGVAEAHAFLLAEGDGAGCDFVVEGKLG